MAEKEIKKIVRESYGKIATQNSSCCVPLTACCGTDQAAEVSKQVGYTDEDINNVPEGANLGLGCGNPLALAEINEGDTVLDLGSGAGFDAFLAARQVGDKGKVIGVDMTSQMIEKARMNAKKGNYENVEFRLGEIENLPVADSSVDLIISNCVINLSTDKSRVFQEALRTLKPGGCLMISDIVLQGELPEFIKNNIDSYVACIAGAMQKEEYLNAIKGAGFGEVEVLEETTYPVIGLTDSPVGQEFVANNEIDSEQIESIIDAVRSIKVKGVKAS